MRSRPAVAVLALGLLASSTVPALAGDDPFQDAREAATRLRFTAAGSVRWLDDFGHHVALVTVTSDRGQFQVNGPGDGSLLWSTGAALLDPPAPGRKYELRTADGEPVAGRDTKAVEIRSSGVLRERLSVDRETGLLLRREQLDGFGRAVRVMSVETLSLLAPDESAAPAPEESSAGGLQPVTLGALPSSFRAAATLAQGYEHVAAFRQGSLVQVVYSDGLHGLSVFTQPGRLAWGSLPGGGRSVPFGGRTAVVYDWPGGQAVTWQAGNLVYTVVGDGPVEEVLAAAASVPGPPSPSLLTRARQRSRAVYDLSSRTGGQGVVARWRRRWRAMRRRSRSDAPPQTP